MEQCSFRFKNTKKFVGVNYNSAEIQTSTECIILLYQTSLQGDSRNGNGACLPEETTKTIHSVLQIYIFFFFSVNWKTFLYEWHDVISVRRRFAMCTLLIIPPVLNIKLIPQFDNLLLDAYLLECIKKKSVY